MQSEKTCHHKDHDHYADDIENIHCFAPIETKVYLYNATDEFWFPTES